jgi:DNA-binding response OmpR family regulator
MHLLIAEPDTWLLETYRDFFVREGFSVSTASTGPHCLETLKQTPPDALVLEPELPCGLGQTILQLIRESRVVGEVPVVVLTRHNGPKPLVPTEFPVVAYHVKPHSMAELANTIRNTINRATIRTATGRNLILYVEEYGPSRNIVARSLAERGFHVIPTKSCEEALDFIDEHRPPLDCVLLKLTDSAIDSTALVDCLQQVYEGLPFVVQSDYLAFDSGRMLRELGITTGRMIENPSDIDAASRILREYCEKDDS